MHPDLVATPLVIKLGFILSPYPVVSGSLGISHVQVLLFRLLHKNEGFGLDLNSRMTQSVLSQIWLGLINCRARRSRVLFSLNLFPNWASWGCSPILPWILAMLRCFALPRNMFLMRIKPGFHVQSRFNLAPASSVYCHRPHRQARQKAQLVQALISGLCRFLFCFSHGWSAHSTLNSPPHRDVW